MSQLSPANARPSRSGSAMAAAGVIIVSDRPMTRAHRRKTHRAAAARGSARDTRSSAIAHPRSLAPGRAANRASARLSRRASGITRPAPCRRARWSRSFVIGSVGAGAWGVGVAETSARSQRSTCFLASAARRIASVRVRISGAASASCWATVNAHSASINMLIVSACRSSGGPPPMRRRSAARLSLINRHRECGEMRAGM